MQMERFLVQQEEEMVVVEVQEIVVLANLAKLESEAIKAARSSLVKEKLAQETALAVGNTGAEFDAFIKSEQAR